MESQKPRFEFNRPHVPVSTLKQDEPEDGPTRVITVRLPKREHEQLKTLAHRTEASLNLICRAALRAVLRAPEIAAEEMADWDITHRPPVIPVCDPAADAEQDRAAEQ